MPASTHRPWVSEEIENDNDLPGILIAITDLKGCDFLNYLYSPVDGMVYRFRNRYNTDEKAYKPVRLCINPSNHQVDMYDTYGIRHSININTIRRHMAIFNKLIK